MSERDSREASLTASERDASGLRHLRSPKLLQQIAAAIPFFLYIYDLVEHRNIYTNRSAAAEWGYSQEEVDRGGLALFSTIIHEDDRERLFGRAADRFSALKDGEVSEVEYRVRRGDGQWRWVHIRDVVFSRDAAGHPRQILGTM